MQYTIDTAQGQRIDEKLDSLTLEERPKRLEFGFHNCRLEGLESPNTDTELLRSWVRQGLSDEKMIDRIRFDLFQ